MQGRQPLPTIWFDVEDLLRHVAVHRRPTGIQRLCFQAYKAVVATAGQSHAVGFVRHDPDGGFRLVDWEDVRTLFDAESGTAAAPMAGAGAAEAAVALRDTMPLADRRNRLDPLRRLSRRIPDRLRRPALQFAAMQVQAGLSLAAIGTALAGLGVRRLRGRLGHRLGRGPGPVQPAVRFPAGGSGTGRPVALALAARPNDVLASIGSPWFDEDYAVRLAHARSRIGLRVAVLVHDLIPAKRPEWCHRGTVRVFNLYYSTVLPLADIVFAVSDSTRRDLVDWCRDRGIQLAAPPVVIPVGSGFDAEPRPPADRPRDAAVPGIAGRYVLFVSTIEIRKNHMLLFRIWRRLLDTMPREQVPQLVFVGAEGWLVRDFMQQLDNTGYLDGKITILRNAGDDDLATLYAGCLFTVFPSLYEGWGLPVTESLMFGKPCIASGGSSIREAGGALTRYFDPTDLDDATDVVRGVLADPDALAEWTEQVQTGFRPVPWAASAAAIVETLFGNHAP